uniref:Nuclear pore complex protein n=1 Tax=Saccoglossus kowalevskii TaxID=10224 RepID=A0ABM0M6C3_SACKO|nr:PREDICTED: nuclear pore complex protein Nup107-like [Saccoglossus kowalevskii]
MAGIGEESLRGKTLESRRSLAFVSPGDSARSSFWQPTNPNIRQEVYNTRVMKEMERHREKRPMHGVFDESPIPREETQSRALKRSVNVQRTLGLLNQATAGNATSGSSLLRTSKTPVRQLRHSTYTPKSVAPSSQFDVSATIGMTPSNRSLLRTPGSATANLSVTMTGLDQTGFMSFKGSTPHKSFFGLIPDTPGKEIDDNTLTSSLLMEDDPGTAATTCLFHEFLDSFRGHPSANEVFDLVSDYEKICADQIVLLEKLIRKSTPGQNKFSRTQEVQNMLTQERNTWRLLGGLYQDRLQTDDDMDDDTLITDDLSKRLSEKQIMDSLFTKDSYTRQNQVVIDWLERNASDQLQDYYDNVEFYSQTVSWENTLHSLQQQQRGIPGIPDRAIVSSMDPDAPIRQKKPLADLDKEDEIRLLRYMFAYIRAGQLDEAQRLCRKCGQAWRAATLEGWKMYHDPNIEEVAASGELKPIEGNPHRDIWKAVCWRMSQEDEFHSYEKAIYAVLSGNLKELLPVCSTWDDVLWAYYKVMVDMRVEQEIRLYFNNKSMESLPSSYWVKNLTPETVFQELQAYPNEVIQGQSKLPYHVIQKYIILNDLDGLIEEMNDWLHNPTLRSSTHLIRFMAHIVLFFRAVGLQTKEELCTAILEAYVRDLIEDKNTLLVATYTSTLPPPMQVTCYAHFLEGIHEKEERQQCLVLAEEAGLDIPTITKTVVENIRTRDAGDITMETDSTSANEAAISEEDKQKIAAIDWLVFDPSQRAEALKQSNAVMRTFLATRKYKACREVFNKIPSDSIDVITKNWQSQAGSAPQLPEDDNAIREYICVKAYLDAHDAFNDWFEHYHNAAPSKPTIAPSATFQERVKHEHEVKQYEQEVDRWQYSLILQSKTVVECIYNVLLFPDGGWMVDQREEEDDMGDSGRTHQMMLLRQLCIPSMCSLLHSVLHNTKQYTRCIQLADVIASEEHQLYKVFRKEELQRLLQMMRESSLQLLDDNKDPLGY